MNSQLTPFTPEQLKSWRKELNLSQADAATALDISRVAYGKLERGENKIDLRTTYACHWITLNKEMLIP